MNLFHKQSFWISLATISLGSFTSFNTYQLEHYNKMAEDTQAQIIMLQQNINELHLRMDNLYDILVSVKSHTGEKL